MAASTQMYPYGTGVGDSILPKKHYGMSGEIPMSTTFVLHGMSHKYIQVRTFG